ncbi:uncharacterized protein TRIADDRAFT_63420 [Trichoplax adhaerens]|uniref:Glyoxylate reductase/hydroxypyruvate reductase n=1 Tax=Trichoplax adhaerens TaxID=10228 RepID=B3SAF7_TRIAD|nr:hypothetical protein TRIADDRAFT_63420 [Trichoplax adhaerens]EDV20251.1 hypothetical protein TRIADDRAFT_63420 [Trichoplax adhaerens]|eukprot:XP_002117201.1 hypothetical protein TRIADDRAFT_63420 [Trichoplax adhaerens]
MTRVYVTRCLPEDSARLLQKDGINVVMRSTDDAIPRQELLDNIPGCDALICMLTDKVDKDVLDAAGKHDTKLNHLTSPSLKVIATVSVGFDHIDLDECKKRNIVVSNTPRVSTDAVAELTVALLLATSRRLMECANAVKNGDWKSWGLLWMCGTELRGSTVGIFGLGRIGIAIATRLQCFGVKQFYYTDIVEVPQVEIEDLLKSCDFIIINCALTPETAGLFNEKAFAKMKNNCVLVNAARGGVINQKDLYQALVSGAIKGAGLDVTDPEPMAKDDPLLTLNNCVVLPHIGSNTMETRTEMASLAVNNVLAVLDGKPLLTPVPR